ncbi:hypothetical protein [Leptolyngbya sp. FACHB-261]|uniref:hypothetical protein n=1 Tax=Leptolyngbya sp. FACHB-261 TaxID=2692806 RepID=UPI00168475DC|nr:hypothetical protein [Leptolyngbya sp. FACHB-261]MBD2101698.1 hypothetical protein [Leptolyngbya sp. FACHB-261]
MSQRSNRLGRVLVPFCILSGLCFSLTTAPLALYGQKQLKAELEDSFQLGGELRSFAVPYISLGLVLSLGVGMFGVMLLKDRRRSRQRTALRNRITQLEAAIAERERWLVDLSLTTAQTHIPEVLSVQAEGADLKAVLSAILECLIAESSEPDAADIAGPEAAQLPPSRTEPLPMPNQQYLSLTQVPPQNLIKLRDESLAGARAGVLQIQAPEPAPEAIQGLERQVEQLTQQIRQLDSKLQQSLASSYTVIRDPGS